ncbi:MerR family DNA-binding transcriptional regulator [Streptomyces sp. NBC_01261]
MLIGEPAERTGTNERLLRHYERAGLLRPDRLPNGYR